MTTGVRHHLGARALAWSQRELVEDEAGDQLLAQEDYWTRPRGERGPSLSLWTHGETGSELSTPCHTL